MPDMTDQLLGLEGRLLAHRRLLARLMALLPQDQRRGLLDWMDGREVMFDGQEDPGAVPAEGLALSLGMSDEFRIIAEMAAALPQDPAAANGNDARAP